MIKPILLNTLLLGNALHAMQPCKAPKKKILEQKNTEQVPTTALLSEFLPPDLVTIIHGYSLPESANTITAPTAIEDHELHTDGRHLVVHCRDYTIRYDIFTGQELERIPFQQVTRYVKRQLHPYRKLLLHVDSDHRLFLYDYPAQKLVELSSEHAIYNALFSPSGRYIIADSTDAKDFDYLDMTDVKEKKIIHSIKHAPFTNHLRKIAMSSDDRLLAVDNHDDYSLSLYNLEDKQCKMLSGHKELIASIVFSHDNKHLLSSSWDNTARFWECATGKELKIYQHDDWVRNAHFGPHATWIATSSNNYVHIVDTASGELLLQTTAEEFQSSLQNTAASTDGDVIAMRELNKVHLMINPVIFLRYSATLERKKRSDGCSALCCAIV